MRTYHIPTIVLLTALVAASLLNSCSDLKSVQDLPTASTGTLRVHDAGWLDTTASNFHGTVLKQSQYNLTECVTCHSAQFTGGTSGVACAKCHQNYPHNADWVNSAKPLYHGNYLKLKNYQLAECTSCHGTNFAGGSSGKQCFTCHLSYPHPTAWGSPTSSVGHGTYLKAKSWQTTECSACHGSSFTGGTSGQSCYTCHAAYPHAAGFGQAGGHPQYLYNQNYPFDQCKQCHGATYNGNGDVSISCMKSGCHVDANNAAKSPESCSTCHGNFTAVGNDLVSAAPPKTILRVTDPTARGVGAHQKHLVTGSTGKSLKCQECHTVPSQLASSGHLGTLPAEVVFNDTLAQIKSGNGSLIPKPSYDPATLKCNNTYCHGNWKIRKATSSSQFIYTDSVMVGVNDSPLWTGGAAAATCTGCHGIPPKGHLVLAVSSCGTCHVGVVDNEGQIVDKTKHINGKINVFGQEYAF